LARQSKDSRIFVETDNHLFEIVVVDPVKRLIEISGTDPVLKAATIGQYLCGIYALDESVRIADWIGRTLRMSIKFRNGIFLSGPVVSAGIIGPGWRYEVF